MRPFRSFLLFLACLPVLACLAQEVSWAPRIYVQQAYDDLETKVSLLEAEQLSWRPDLCMAFARIDLGDTYALDLWLEAGTTYTFIGGGDSDINILDSYLVDADRQIVAIDTLDDRTPLMEFEPTTSALYSLRLQLVDCSADFSYVGIAFLQDKGDSVADPGVFNQLYNRSLDIGESINELSNGVKYHYKANQWSTFVFYIQSGQDAIMEQLDLAIEGTQWIFGQAESSLGDIDLSLLNEGHEVLAQDDKSGDYPVIMHEGFQPTDSYGISLHANQTDASGLSIISILSGW